MARIFITGSSDGLGKMAAGLLISQGHRVVLHAKNEQRAADALKGNPKADATKNNSFAVLPCCSRT